MSSKVLKFKLPLKRRLELFEKQLEANPPRIWEMIFFGLLYEIRGPERATEFFLSRIRKRAIKAGFEWEE
jgi:hypothetical protein